mmetsp:Transcript_15521/g.29476  ORF Transcript_15521/g.29476 Transcript_15521/m.29476 type:complete len:94 (-) Transcript_15521:460-741(-)|eukprot:CAMPEP_0170194188 /NCGR_PEP_ID=MMETSP0040_2-20121228/58657_1 /TAXON_ID=641309 /ORGANISM="Lotharella oceanica, Strain CCMP622" /LENGTH=93 /DNA_ID=CAMNT_0010443043 /DNA_START=311 /DNA_END=592 /DNA_ORIENTATION=-
MIEFLSVGVSRIVEIVTAIILLLGADRRTGGTAAKRLSAGAECDYDHDGHDNGVRYEPHNLIFQILVLVAGPTSTTGQSVASAASGAVTATPV